MSHRILIVDDESAVRRLLRRCFEGAGYSVEEADSGDTMLRLLEQQPIDLITLDIGLGTQDGLDLARQVRQHRNVPIIMVTGKGDLIDTVVGLEVGADDYITKPFELREVLARVRAVLRRVDGVLARTGLPSDTGASAGSVTGVTDDAVVDRNPASTASSTSTSLSPSTDANANSDIENPGHCYGFGGWMLDTASRELYTPDRSICELTTAEFELLKLLVTHARQVLSRDQIMDQIKGSDWVPTDRTIDNQISRLRRKLSTGDKSQLIKTVRGTGYMFNAKVELN